MAKITSSQYLGFSMLFSPLAEAATKPPEASAQLGQMLFGLVAVILMLFGLLWLLKKISLPRQMQNKRLRVIGAAAVGQRERVVMLDIGEKILVLGVTNHQVNLLHTMDADDIEVTPSNSEKLPTASNDFARRLQHLIKRRGNNDI